MLVYTLYISVTLHLCEKKEITGYLPSLLVGTYVKGITITIMKGGETGVVFWSKVYLSI